MALICGAITWHFVRARANERKLAEDARVCRVRAEQRDADAEYRLALLYQQGKGVPQDYSEALRWCQRAADQGNAKAQYGLGSMYYYGQGVPQDYAQALRWYRKAAEHGDPKAEDALGSLYYNGHGVPQDRAVAAQWYRQAADHGLARAQYDLGYMYYYGLGVPQDRAEANRLFHEAAHQGNEYAQRALGLTRTRPSTFNRITLAIIFLGSLWLLIGGLSRIGRRQPRMALTGLMGLLYGGFDLYRYFYASPSAGGFDFATHLLGGVSLGMALSVVSPKSTKAVLAASGILFVAFNLFAVAHYGLRHLAPAIRILSLANGLFIGVSIPSAILLWLEGKRRRGRNGSDGMALPGP